MQSRKKNTTGQKVTGLQKQALLAKISGKTTLETQKEVAAALDLPIKDLTAHLLEMNQRDSSWASVLETLADQYLAKKKTTTASVSHRDNKTLTSKTRKAIRHRDSCCQFKDPKTGRQCQSTYAVQIDHRTSQWAGGRHTPDNLQILCANHNRHKYQKEINLKFKTL